MFGDVGPYNSAVPPYSQSSFSRSNTSFRNIFALAGKATGERGVPLIGVSIRLIAGGCNERDRADGSK